MPIVTIAQRNRAPSAEDARHDVHAFDVDDAHPLQPLIFSQSIGGGFAERGGSCRLGVHELADNTFWRELLSLAGCGWVIGILEARMVHVADDLVQWNAEAARAILDARAENTLCLQRSSIAPDAGRPPLHAGPRIEHADCSIRCEACAESVNLPFDRILGNSAAWLHGLSDVEWHQVRTAFACLVDIGPSGHARLLSHDAGTPAFGPVACDACGQRHVAYVTCEEAQPALYRLRLQGLARVVPDLPHARLPVEAIAPVSASSPARIVLESEPEPAHDSGPVMSGWWSAQDEPPLYYLSSSNKPGAIAREIAIIHARMEARRAEERSERGNALYLQSDGTQSKLRMYWVDRSKGEAVGDCDYTLVLRDAEFTDADAFESTCRRAVGFFVRKHAPEDLHVFFHREFDPHGRRVHAVDPRRSGR